MGRVITVTSGKGGVGKTTTTANLATALSSLGHRVVCIDTDIGLRNLDLIMGLEDHVVYNVVDVIEERATLAQALIRHRAMPDLFLLPASQSRDKSAIDELQMMILCNKLKNDFDFVLIDSPAGIEHGFRVSLAPADQVIIVTTPEVAALRDADRVVGILDRKDRFAEPRHQSLPPKDGAAGQDAHSRRSAGDTVLPVDRDYPGRRGCH